MIGPAVLVVEDMPQIRATAIQLFQELGCAVFDAYNGHGALKILEARPEIQVLFADVRMPGMSGPELAQAARRLRPDLRIVLTSGYVSRDEVPGDIPFVPKPWRTGDLVQLVRSASCGSRDGAGEPAPESHAAGVVRH
jgi:CheY-like chemotaxis protein